MAVSPVEITGLDDDVRRIAVEILADAADALMSDLLEAAPVNTGELVDSAYGPVVDDTEMSATLGFSAPQADYTDLGTPPHVIESSIAPALHFFWADGPNGPGEYTFNSVNHPGIEGSNWFSDLVEAWPDYVDVAAQDA